MILSFSNIFKIFPDGFPEDFSILATFKASTATAKKGKKGRNKATLFSIYSSEGIEVLSVRIARRLRMGYQGILSGRNKQKIKFGAQLGDAK